MMSILVIQIQEWQIDSNSMPPLELVLDKQSLSPSFDNQAQLNSSGLHSFDPYQTYTTCQVQRTFTTGLYPNKQGSSSNYKQ